MLEHGATSHSSATGCGVDHAHVHFVPLESSLSPAVRSVAPELEWTQIDVSEIERFARHREYLAYTDDVRDDLSGIYITLLKEPQSQFFRKAIAAQVNAVEFYNYREHMFLGNIRKTYASFRQHDSVA